MYSLWSTSNNYHELSDHFTDSASKGNKSQRTANLDSLTLIEKHQSHNPKGNLSVLAEELGTF